MTLTCLGFCSSHQYENINFNMNNKNRDTFFKPPLEAFSTMKQAHRRVLPSVLAPSRTRQRISSQGKSKSVQNYHHEQKRKRADWERIVGGMQSDKRAPSLLNRGIEFTVIARRQDRAFRGGPLIGHQWTHTGKPCHVPQIPVKTRRIKPIYKCRHMTKVLPRT